MAVGAHEFVARWRSYPTVNARSPVKEWMLVTAVAVRDVVAQGVLGGLKVVELVEQAEASGAAGQTAEIADRQGVCIFETGSLAVDSPVAAEPLI
jgi:hypothetical protein